MGLFKIQELVNNNPKLLAKQCCNWYSLCVIISGLGDQECTNSLHLHGGAGNKQIPLISSVMRIHKERWMSKNYRVQVSWYGLLNRSGAYRLI